MNLIKTITDLVTWVEGLFHKKYGIRTLYMMLFLLPSICLGLLYYFEVSNSRELLIKLEKSRHNEIVCIEEKSKIRLEVRKEVLEEFKETYETIKSFELEVLLENQRTVEKIKKLESKL